MRRCVHLSRIDRRNDRYCSYGGNEPPFQHKRHSGWVATGRPVILLAMCQTPVSYVTLNGQIIGGGLLSMFLRVSVNKKHWLCHVAILCADLHLWIAAKTIKLVATRWGISGDRKDGMAYYPISADFKFRTRRSTALLNYSGIEISATSFYTPFWLKCLISPFWVNTPPILVTAQVMERAAKFSRKVMAPTCKVRKDLGGRLNKLEGYAMFRPREEPFKADRTPISNTNFPI